MSDKKEPKQCKSKKNNSHFYWIIGILIVIICGLVAAILCGFDDNTVLNFISAFSTLLSIVLSIIAIFYTFLSGVESQRVNQKTECEVQHINDKIELLSDKMKNNYLLISNLDKNISSVIDVLKMSESNIASGTELDSQEENHSKENIIENLNGLKMQLHDIAKTFNDSMK